MGYIATLYQVTKDVSSHLPLGEMTENSSLHSLRGAWPCCPGPRMPISAISGNYIVAIGEEFSIQRGVTDGPLGGSVPLSHRLGKQPAHPPVTGSQVYNVASSYQVVLPLPPR